MYYYKLDATTSQRINQMNDLVNDYEQMVVDWLSFNFNINEDTSYEVFNDIFRGTESRERNWSR